MLLNNLKGQLKKYSKHDSFWGWFFIFPATVFFCAFLIYPSINALFISLFDYNLMTTPKFIGLENYRYLFNNGPFLKSLFTTLIYVVGTVIPLIALSLFLAVLLNTIGKTKAIYRTLFFLPYVMSWVAVAMIFQGVFNPEGLATGVIKTFNNKTESIFWLSSMPSALWVLILVRIWRAFGYYMILFIAGLQNVPNTLYEQAAIDGITPWKRFWYITWPLLSPTTIVVSLMCITYGFQAFAVPQIITNGGPGGGTRILSIYIYEQGFQYFRMGQASAVSVIIFILIASVALIQSRITRNITIQS